MSLQIGPPDAKARRSFVIDPEALPREGEGDSNFGSVSWRTLISADRTPSAGMVLGLAEFGPYGTLKPHRHSHAEFYLGFSGDGTIMIDGVSHWIRPGVAVYVEGDTEHGVLAGPDGLCFAYGFAADRFSDIKYRFSPIMSVAD